MYIACVWYDLSFKLLNQELCFVTMRRTFFIVYLFCFFHQTPEGAFRATFEDKILISGKYWSCSAPNIETEMITKQILPNYTIRNVWRSVKRVELSSLVVSPDIVFIRTWYPVTIPNFYNPVTSLLLPPDQKETWQGMRSVGQLRRDLGLKAPVNSDSLYKVS